jgi:Holliday junction resolvase RusA-like endonuclease
MPKKIHIGIRRIASDSYNFIEDYQSCGGLLMDVPTKCPPKKETIEKIRTDLNFNEVDETIKKERLDVAIILEVNKHRFKTQDLDNVAKIVLDAIKKPKDSADVRPYFFDDDRQIVRLLVQKNLRNELQDTETSQISISARKHNPEKYMKLKRVGPYRDQDDYEKSIKY